MDIYELAAGIEMVLMDVDGVLTDGRLYNVPDAQGKMVETKGFDSQLRPFTQNTVWERA